MVNDVFTAALARDNSSMGNGKAAVKSQGEELLDLLTRTKHLRDLLTLKSFELAAMYARVAARDGHAYASSIARISLNCVVPETEARNWISLGEAMLQRVAKSE